MVESSNTLLKITAIVLIIFDTTMVVVNKDGAFVAPLSIKQPRGKAVSKRSYVSLQRYVVICKNGLVNNFV